MSVINKIPITTTGYACNKCGMWHKRGSKKFDLHYSSTFHENGVHIPKTVHLRCSHPGCPRKIELGWDRTMPLKTFEIRSLCPWHEKDGDFGTETYYDCKGRELEHG